MENRLETWVRLGKTFEHEAFQDELEGLRDRLKLGLSEHAPEGGESVAELAERIKALRASVTVEAAPERTVRKAARAERPVTARIREQLKEVQPKVEEALPVAEVIALPVKPVAVQPESPIEIRAKAGVVIPAMYQERGTPFGLPSSRRKGGR